MAPALAEPSAALLPVLPAQASFSEPGYHVWCGAPVAGNDGRYHLLYSRWPGAATFAPGWAIRSEIAHAVADTPPDPNPG